MLADDSAPLVRRPDDGQEVVQQRDEWRKGYWPRSGGTAFPIAPEEIQSLDVQLAAPEFPAMLGKLAS
jgi:hypothetical protein